MGPDRVTPGARPGARSPGPPTLDQVAAAAGVSRSTASRAINGEARVSPATVEAVADAVRALGYSPNRAARSLVTRRTGSVALVVPETGSRIFSDPYFGEILDGVTRGLAASPLQLVILVATDPRDVGQMVRYLRHGQVDGALVVSHHRDDHLPEELSALGLPVVLGGRPVERDGALIEGRIPYVDVDNRGGARLAGEHLTAIGRTRLGTVTGPLDMPAGVDRRDGWHDALAAAGFDAGVEAEGDFTVDGGYAATERLFARHPDLDGVFVASDLMATGALQALRALGRRVPEDVAVVGFDDFVLAASAVPSLTTVHQPSAEVGLRMATILLDLLAGRPVPQQREVLPTRLVVRDSA